MGISRKHSVALAVICIICFIIAAAVLIVYWPTTTTTTSTSTTTTTTPPITTTTTTTTPPTTTTTENVPESYVTFKYEASFTYRGSEENLPLVGCGVQFPCPTVDGEPVIKQENLKWQLWGPVEENGAAWSELEVDNNNVFQWVGERANSPPDNDFYWSPLGAVFHLISAGMTYWDSSITWKIALQNDFDNLYAGETLKSIGYLSLPLENAARVTLRENDGRVLGGLSWLNDNLEYWEGSPDALVLASNVSFSVQLSKQVDNDFETIAQFSKMAENIVSGYRYPILLL